MTSEDLSINESKEKVKMVLRFILCHAQNFSH